MGSTDTSLERKLQYLETKIDGAIGTIILDHPERRNALSRQLVDAVVETLDRFVRERTRVVAEPSAFRACPRTEAT